MGQIGDTLTKEAFHIQMSVSAPSVSVSGTSTNPTHIFNMIKKNCKNIKR